jgi:hypothetical protein
MHRLSPGRRALAGLGLSLLYLNLVPVTPAVAQAAPTADQSYYWCRRQMMVHGTTVQYVSRILVNRNPIARGLAQDVVGQAFVRYLINTYKPDNPKVEEGTFYNWSYACVTSWPYGYSALDDPHKRALAAGAVTVDWEYTPDQDVQAPYASQPAPAPAPQTASEAAIAQHCGHIANEYALEQCRQQWGGKPAQAAAKPALPGNPPTTATSPSAAPAPVPHPPAAQIHTVVATTAPPPVPHPAPTPTPPAPIPPKTAFVVCVAESDLHTKYINPPIDGGSGNNATWMKSYRAYLEPRYHYRGYIRCNRQATRDGAQAFYEKMIEKTRALPGNGGVPPKIVVTEWK